MKWLTYALLCLLFWGIWGVVLKYVSARLAWYQVYVLANAAVVAVTLLVAYKYSDGLSAGPGIAVLAFTAGLLGTVGYLFLILSLASGGQASIVIPLTALYPALTAVLSIFVLREGVSAYKVLGIVLAVIAIMLLSYESS